MESLKMMCYLIYEGSELFQPKTRKITSGYQNYMLTGLNLRYMYLSQKQFSDSLKYINMSSMKWCSYYYVFIFINFCFKVRYMYRTIMDFLREVIF